MLFVYWTDHFWSACTSIHSLTMILMMQMRNRESAARSRAKRLEYTHELEVKVKTLKDVNKELREKIIKLAKAPADPNGALRRTRTMPL